MAPKSKAPASPQSADGPPRKKRTPSPSPSATPSADVTSSPLKPSSGFVGVRDIQHATTVEGAARRLGAQFATCTFAEVKEIWGAFLGLKPPTEEYERKLQRERGGQSLPGVNWATEDGFTRGANEVSGTNLFVDIHTQPLPDRYGQRKPDCILLHRGLDEARRHAFVDDANKRSWRDINMTIQVKQSQTLYDARDQVVRDAEQIFLAQPGRQFAFGIGIKDNNLQLHVVCRTGLFTTPKVDIGRYPHFFARLLGTVTNLPSEKYGLWPEFCPVAELAKAPKFGFKLARSNGSLSGRIESVISKRHDLIGRGTCVFRGSVKKDRGGDPEEVAIKLSFRDAARMPEWEVLAAIEDARKKTGKRLRNLPTFVFGQKVAGVRNIKDIFGASAWDGIGQRNPNMVFVDRVYDINITSPATVNLLHARSAKQLIGAIIDSIKAHETVHSLGYLHRDVSFANILLGPNWSSDDWEKDAEDAEDCCRGILNDFDMAKKVSEEGTGAGRTGTYPFIAIALLENPDERHTISHDLESFFYVIIWIASLYDCSTSSLKPVLDDATDNSAARRSATRNTDSQPSEFLEPPSEISSRKLANSNKQELTRNGKAVKVCKWIDDPDGNNKMGCWSSDFQWHEVKAQILPCWKSLVDSGILDEVRKLVCYEYNPDDSALLDLLAPQAREAFVAARKLDYRNMLRILEEKYPKL